MIGTNEGHGHVWARPDGLKARCGGPAICSECAKDQAALANVIPRRSYVNLLTAEETMLRNALIAVESLGADPLLTACVVAISQARERLADWVDKQRAP